MGTGFHGTLAGNVYHCRKNIFDDIRAYKGMEPALPEEEEADDGEDHDAASREEVRREHRYMYTPCWNRFSRARNSHPRAVFWYGQSDIASQ